MERCDVKTSTLMFHFSEVLVSSCERGNIPGVCTSTILLSLTRSCSVAERDSIPARLAEGGLIPEWGNSCGEEDVGC